MCLFGQNVPEVTMICCDLVGSIYRNCAVNVLSNSLVICSVPLGVEYTQRYLIMSYCGVAKIFSVPESTITVSNILCSFVYRLV